MLNDISRLFFAGIDIGSTMSKAVIVDASGAMRAYVVGPTGAEHRRRANKVMEDVMLKAGITLDEVAYIISTGYGRVSVPFADKQVTELTCHAKGVSTLFPDVRTAIDIGGQDAKVLKIKNGRLTDFLTNEKCAAGTGRFLEVAADTLGLEPQRDGPHLFADRYTRQDKQPLHYLRPAGDHLPAVRRSTPSRYPGRGLYRRDHTGGKAGTSA